MQELSLPYLPSDPRIEFTNEYMGFVDALDLHDDPALALGLWMRVRNHLGQTPNVRGSLGKMSPKRLASVAGWKGDAQAFHTAMVGSGLLVVAPDGELLVARWEDDGGRVLRDRTRKRLNADTKAKRGPKPKPPISKHLAFPPGGFPISSGRIPDCRAFEQQHGVGVLDHPDVCISTGAAENTSLQQPAVAAQETGGGEVVGYIQGEIVPTSEILVDLYSREGIRAAGQEWERKLAENAPYSRGLIALAWENVARCCQETRTLPNSPLFISKLVTAKQTRWLELPNAPRINAKHAAYAQRRQEREELAQRQRMQRGGAL